MNARVLRLLLMAVWLVAAPAAVQAQEGISKKKQEKIQAQKEKEKKKAKARKEKDDRKRHLSIQDKETRKRIKRHTKRADRSGSGAHRDRGLFRRKR
jgi:hypothetical protein